MGAASACRRERGTQPASTSTRLRCRRLRAGQRPHRGRHVQLQPGERRPHRRLVQRQAAHAGRQVEPERRRSACIVITWQLSSHVARAVRVGELAGGRPADRPGAARAVAGRVVERRGGRAELREQPGRRLGADARDAGQVVGGVAAQRGEVEVLLRPHAGHHHQPLRVEQRRGVDAAVEDPQHPGVLVDQRERVPVGGRHHGARADRRRVGRRAERARRRPPGPAGTTTTTPSSRSTSTALTSCSSRVSGLGARCALYVGQRSRRTLASGSSKPDHDGVGADPVDRRHQLRQQPAHRPHRPAVRRAEPGARGRVEAAVQQRVAVDGEQGPGHDVTRVSRRADIRGGRRRRVRDGRRAGRGRVVAPSPTGSAGFRCAVTRS